MWLYMEVDDKAPRAVLANSGHVVTVTSPGRVQSVQLGSSDCTAIEGDTRLAEGQVVMRLKSLVLCSRQVWVFFCFVFFSALLCGLFAHKWEL